MRTTIELTKEEVTFAGRMGMARTNENKNRRDIADYKQSAFNLTSLQANCVGVVAELAVAKWLGLPQDVLEGKRPEVWAAFVEEADYGKFLGAPDILGVIEVRRAHRRTSPIPIRKKDVRAGALLIQPYVDINYLADGKINCERTVELLGWADAPVDYKTGNIPWWTDGDARTAAEKKPMDTLDITALKERAGVLL